MINVFRDFIVREENRKKNIYIYIVKLDYILKIVSIIYNIYYCELKYLRKVFLEKVECELGFEGWVEIRWRKKVI